MPAFMKILAGPFILTSAFLTSYQAFAELDPELAELSAAKDNASGLYATGALMFGEAQAAGKSRSGAAYLASGEIGYIMPRGSWDRLEASVEFMSGVLNFKSDDASKADQTTQVGGALLAKFGQGYSLGDKVKAVWKVGIGPMLAKYQTRADGVTAKSTSLINGLVGQIGLDVLMPAGSWFDFVGGFKLNHFQYDVDTVEVDGTEYDVKSGFNVNVPVVEVGLRFKL